MSVTKATAFEQSGESKTRFNLNDIAAQARQIVADAHRQAQKIVADAQAQVRRQIQDAHGEGYQKGFDQGLEQGKKEGAEKAWTQTRDEFAQQSLALCQSFQNALAQFDRHKAELLWQAEQGTVALAVAIAQKVLKDAVVLHPEITINTIKAALELVAQMTNLVIRVHPEHLEHLRQMTDMHEEIISSYKHVQFEADSTVSRGGAIVHTDKGEIDAQLELQIQRLAQELLMNRPAAVSGGSSETSADNV